MSRRLGLEALIDDTVRPLGPGRRARGRGRKVLTLVASVLVGGCCIDDADGGWGRAQRLAVLPFAPLAPSTLGTFLRSFTFGHVRQLDKVPRRWGLRRAWSVGAAPARRRR